MSRLATGWTDASALTRLIWMPAAGAVSERWGGTRQYVTLRGGVGSKMRNILVHPGRTAECARDLQTSEQWVRLVRNQGGSKRRRPGDGEASVRRRRHFAEPAGSHPETEGP